MEDKNIKVTFILSFCASICFFISYFIGKEMLNLILGCTWFIISMSYAAKISKNKNK